MLASHSLSVMFAVQNFVMLMTTSALPLSSSQKTYDSVNKKEKTTDLEVRIQFMSLYFSARPESVFVSYQKKSGS